MKVSVSMNSYRYFSIPFENVPESPTYTVWFATWTTARPALEPGITPLVVGATFEDKLPANAVELGVGSKDPLPPPPPPPPALKLDLEDYQKSIDAWLR